jgi:hypothetical protein
MAMVGDPCHAISRLSRSRSRRSQRLTTPAVIPNIDCDVVAKLDALISEMDVAKDASSAIDPFSYFSMNNGHTT